MMSQPVNFPLRISYPAHLPYASIRANAVELAGDRVIITYSDVQELKTCLELHREAHLLVADSKSGYVPVKLEVTTRELNL
jgi:hypothetical protein